MTELGSSAQQQNGKQPAQAAQHATEVTGTRSLAQVEQGGKDTSRVLQRAAEVAEVAPSFQYPGTQPLPTQPDLPRPIVSR